MVTRRSIVFLGLFSLLAVGCASQAPQPTVALQATEAPSVGASATQELSLAPEEPALEEPVLLPTEVSEPRRYTFVLVGGDLHRLGQGARTGTFAIVTGVFPKDGPGDIVLIDVPRDLYLPISCKDGDLDWIVAAYPLGLLAGNGKAASGLDCVRQVVKDNFGLEVNGGVALVTGDAFESLVDSFGGLSVTPRDEHRTRCSGIYRRWRADETYLMNGEDLKCYLKTQNSGADRDQGRSYRAGKVVAAMSDQWLRLYVEHPVQSVMSTWSFWKENVYSMSLNFAQTLRLAPLIPNAVDAEVRSARLRFGEDVISWTAPQGASGLLPVVDLREWTACAVANPVGQELLGCSSRVSTLP